MMKSYIVIRRLTVFFAVIATNCFFPWFRLKVAVFIGFLIGLCVAYCYALAYEDLPPFEDIYPRIELPAMPMPQELVMLGRASPDLITAFWAGAACLLGELYLLARFLYRLTQSRKYGPDPSWNIMVRYPGEPAEPPKSPVEGSH